MDPPGAGRTHPVYAIWMAPFVAMGPTGSNEAVSYTWSWKMTPAEADARLGDRPTHRLPEET
jgi:hypothetical protein